jgi:hypothetical protein
MADNYSINKKSSGWAVTRGTSEKPASIHPTQTDAWTEARRLARGAGSEAVLRSADGQIRARNSYGRDPFPPKK